MDPDAIYRESDPEDANPSSDSEEEYTPLYDPDRFVRDGNNIRFQLPSQSASLTLARNLDEAQRKATSLLRRKTTKRSVVRRKSTKAPPVGTLNTTVIQHFSE